MFRRMLIAAALSATFVSAAHAASVKYYASLSGAHEVPANTTKGKGSFSATLNTVTKELDYKLSVSGLTGPALAAHIHGPAAAGKNAGVMVPLGDKNPMTPIVGSATLTDDQIKALNSGMTYVNVHTAANKGGEIRGQVMMEKMAMPMKKPMAMPMKK